MENKIKESVGERLLSRSALIYSILATLALVLLNYCHNQEVVALSTNVEELKKRPLDKDVTFWQDKYSNEHATVEEVVLERNQMKEYSDSISKLLKIKSKQIDQISIIEAKIDIKAPLIVVEGETIQEGVKFKVQKFTYDDKPWLSINGFVGAPKDSVFVKGTDTIVNTQYWERKWFLGRKNWKSDISNVNKHIKITGIRTVGIRPKDPNFIIAPSITVIYPLGVVPGVSIVYYPLSLKF